MVWINQYNNLSMLVDGCEVIWVRVARLTSGALQHELPEICYLLVGNWVSRLFIIFWVHWIVLYKYNFRNELLSIRNVIYTVNLC